MHLADAFIQSDLQLHLGYTFFISTCVPWESNPQPFALLTQCSTTEPQEHHFDPLIFDENIADNWSKFEKEWCIYCNAGLSDKSQKVQAYTLEKSEAFTFTEEEDREYPDVLLQKMAELCLPTKNRIMDRHVFNTTNQKPKAW